MTRSQISSWVVATSAALSLSSCIDPGLVNPGYAPSASSYRRPYNYNDGGYYRGTPRDGHGYELYDTQRDTPHTRYDPYARELDHDHDHGRPQGRSSGSNWGGTDEWYKSGKNLGKRDRKEGRSSEWSRHRNHFDAKTEDVFARGYRDGYNGR
jgi:hypothetical protein